MRTTPGIPAVQPMWSAPRQYAPQHLLPSGSRLSWRLRPECTHVPGGTCGRLEAAMGTGHATDKYRFRMQKAGSIDPCRLARTLQFRPLRLSAHLMNLTVAFAKDGRDFQCRPQAVHR